MDRARRADASENNRYDDAHTREKERLRSAVRRDASTEDEMDRLDSNEHRRMMYNIPGRKIRTNEVRKERRLKLWSAAVLKPKTSSAEEDAPTLEEHDHALATLASAARRAKVYRENLKRRARAGDASAIKQTSERIRRAPPVAPKVRASLPAGAAPSLHPLLTSLPPALLPPSSSASLTAMEKSLLLEDALICWRMHHTIARQAHASEPIDLSADEFNTLLQKQRQIDCRWPSKITATAIAILAGRFATDVVSDEVPQLTHMPHYHHAFRAILGESKSATCAQMLNTQESNTLEPLVYWGVGLPKLRTLPLRSQLSCLCLRA